ncbi:hypothetical protein LzC2_37810 [Planctomycetes bacterium LzC2]|uniref:Uncharacterized protein n=1 Tax=Alienimonas chondri TaxID=2681879 RepID=A0ABX1VHS2_9PLAN|nr:hypothetical protein [Alienimonas chondri]
MAGAGHAGHAARSADPGGIAGEGEAEDVDHVGELRADRQPHEAAVGADDRGDGHRDAFLNQLDVRLIGDGVNPDDRRQRGHEGQLGAVLHEGLLTVVQGHLRGEHQVVPAVALNRVDEEEGFDVAQDREADVHPQVQVAGDEVRHADAEAALLEGHVQVRADGTGSGRRVAGQADDDAVAVVVAVPQVAARSGIEHIGAGTGRVDERGRSALLQRRKHRQLEVREERGVARRERVRRGAGFRRGERIDPPEGAGVDRAGAQFVLHVEVEVDADPLEELVGHRDESHLDRHLQVLQTTQLSQQFADLLVHGLRLANDQGEGGFTGLQRPATAQHLPAFRLHGGADQLGKFLEPHPATVAADAGADATAGRRVHEGAGEVRVRQGAAHGGDAEVAHAQPGRTEAAVQTGLAALLQHRIDAGGGTAEVLDRDHQIRHRVRLGDHLAAHPVAVGDLQHVVGDDVAEVQRLQDQVQRALQADALDVDRDRHVDAGADGFHVGRVGDDVDVRQGAQVGEHLGQRGVLEVQADRPLHRGGDHLLLRAVRLHRAVGAVPHAAAGGHVAPVLGEREVVVERDARLVDRGHHRDESFFLGLGDLLTAGFAVGELRLPDHQLRFREVRVDGASLLGRGQRLDILPVPQLIVEAIDQNGHLLLDADLAGLLHGDFIADGLVPSFQFQLRRHLAGVALDRGAAVGDVPQHRSLQVVPQFGDLDGLLGAFQHGAGLVDVVRFLQALGPEDGVQHFAAKLVEANVLRLTGQLQPLGRGLTGGVADGQILVDGRSRGDGALGAGNLHPAGRSQRDEEGLHLLRPEGVQRGAGLLGFMTGEERFQRLSAIAGLQRGHAVVVQLTGGRAGRGVVAFRSGQRDVGVRRGEGIDRGSGERAVRGGGGDRRGHVAFRKLVDREWVGRRLSGGRGDAEGGVEVHVERGVADGVRRGAGTGGLTSGGQFGANRLRGVLQHAPRHAGGLGGAEVRFGLIERPVGDRVAGGEQGVLRGAAGQFLFGRLRLGGGLRGEGHRLGLRSDFAEDPVRAVRGEQIPVGVQFPRLKGEAAGVFVTAGVQLDAGLGQQLHRRGLGGSAFDAVRGGRGAAPAVGRRGGRHGVAAEAAEVHRGELVREDLSFGRVRDGRRAEGRQQGVRAFAVRPVRAERGSGGGQLAGRVGLAPLGGGLSFGEEEFGGFGAVVVVGGERVDVAEATQRVAQFELLLTRELCVALGGVGQPRLGGGVLAALHQQKARSELF